MRRLPFACLTLGCLLAACAPTSGIPPSEPQWHEEITGNDRNSLDAREQSMPTPEEFEQYDSTRRIAFLRSFLPGMSVIDRSPDGVWGEFQRDGTMVLGWAPEYNGRRQAPRLGAGRWVLTYEELKMMLPEDTVATKLESLRLTTRRGKTVLLLDDNCLIIVGDDRADPGDRPGDLDTLVSLQEPECTPTPL